MEASGEVKIYLFIYSKTTLTHMFQLHIISQRIFTMKKAVIELVLLLIILFNFNYIRSDEKANILYFDQKPPGKIAEIFVPGIIEGSVL